MLLFLAACTPVDLADDPVAYIDDLVYRRGILERDLEHGDNDYGAERFDQYGIRGSDWEALPEWDPPSAPVPSEPRLTFDPASATTLTPPALPATPAAWIALGERVFFEYPLRTDNTWTTLVDAGEPLAELGLIERDGSWVGLRIVDVDGQLHASPTCAQCHASELDGQITGQLSNRRFDIGQAQLRANAVADTGSELDSTLAADYERLGPGRADVLGDRRFNPYAYPDFGGIADKPRLQHNGNWRNTASATLAVRCETLFITSSRREHRIPRVLSWALAEYLRSLPPAPGPDAPSDASQRGEQVFDRTGCDACHAPPLFTSDQVLDVGTDPSAFTSPARQSPGYRVPSLRGVGRAAPYLHHGAVDSLDQLFDPTRQEPGHDHGLDLDAPDRSDLIAYLRTL